MGVISVITGGALAILGNYLAIHKNQGIEKKKLMREKIEETYLLSIEIKEWTQSRLFDVTSILDLRAGDIVGYTNSFGFKRRFQKAQLVLSTE